MLLIIKKDSTFLCSVHPIMVENKTQYSNYNYLATMVSYIPKNYSETHE